MKEKCFFNEFVHQDSPALVRDVVEVDDLVAVEDLAMPIPKLSNFLKSYKKCVFSLNCQQTQSLRKQQYKIFLICKFHK